MAELYFETYEGDKLSSLVEVSCFYHLQENVEAVNVSWTPKCIEIF